MDWLAKDPDETRRYSIPWAEIYPDTIASFTLTRTTGTVTIGETDNDDRAVYALISGGADGETATFLHRITTVDGQVLERTIALRIGAGADVLSPVTSYTKGELVIQALGDIGIANYVFDTEAEEDIAALRRLDAMMADWQAKLEPLGYRQPTISGASLPSDATGIDEAIVDAVIANLAVRLAPSYGKTPGPGITRAAVDGRSTVFSMYARHREIVPNPRMPVGAGYRRWARTFFSPAP